MPWRRAARRWLVRDRAWVGRCVAWTTDSLELEGCRIYIDSAQVTDSLRCRLLYGRYERTERELLRRHLDPSRPVVELGGGIGAVACIVNRRLTNPPDHVVVEPNPALLPLIQRNRDANDAKFSLVHGAIGYTESARLSTCADLLGSRTGGPGGMVVPAFTLHDIIERTGYDVCTVVCDIEGTEVDLIGREAEVLRAHVAMLVMEEHPNLLQGEDRALMFAQLHRIGFDRVDAIRKVHVFANTALITTSREEAECG